MSRLTLRRLTRVTDLHAMGVTAAFIITRSSHLRSHKPPTQSVAIHTGRHKSVAAGEGEDNRESLDLSRLRNISHSGSADTMTLGNSYEKLEMMSGIPR